MVLVPIDPEQQLICPAGSLSPDAANLATWIDHALNRPGAAALLIQYARLLHPGEVVSEAPLREAFRRQYGRTEMAKI